MAYPHLKFGTGISLKLFIKSEGKIFASLFLSYVPYFKYTPTRLILAVPLEILSIRAEEIPLNSMELSDAYGPGALYVPEPI